MPLDVVSSALISPIMKMMEDEGVWASRSEVSRYNSSLAVRQSTRSHTLDPSAALSSTSPLIETGGGRENGRLMGKPWAVVQLIGEERIIGWRNNVRNAELADPISSKYFPSKLFTA